MKHKTIHSTFKRLLFAALAASSFAAYAALPEGYQRSPYLRGDGKAYIELDFPLTHEQTVTIEFVCRDRNGSQGILGARESATANNCGIVSGASLMMDYGDYSKTRVYSKDYKTGVLYRATLGANLREVREVDSGDVLFSEAEPSDLAFTTPMNCAVFFFNNNLSDVGKFTGDIYSIVISRTATGEVEHNLVPVVKKSIGYLCDSLSGRIYGNVAREGSFDYDIAFDETNVSSDAIGAPACRSVVSVNYSGAETLWDFPVLVRLSPERVAGFSYSQLSSASDLSFCHSDGTVYPFDVDTWNPPGESLVWVRVPRLPSGGTKFFMRWGHEEPLENTPASVWNKYAAVFHFNGETADVTGHGLQLTPTGVQVASDAALGGCYAINGGFGCVNLDPPYGYLSNVNDMTVSGWFKKSSQEDFSARLISGKSSAEENTFELIFYSDGNIWGRGSGNTLTVKTGAGERTWLAAGQWSYLTARYATSFVRLFADGCDIAFGNVGPVMSADMVVGVGNSGGGADGNAFKGMVDEVRFFNGVASADWIAAECATVKNREFVTASPAARTRSCSAISFTRLSNVSARGFSVEVELGEVKEAGSVVVRWGTSPDAMTESRMIGVAASGAKVSAKIAVALQPAQTYYVCSYVEGAGASEADPDGLRPIVAPLPDDGSYVPSDSRGKPGFRAVVSIAENVVGEMLTGFPVLVRISESLVPGFRYDDLASPADISFAGYDGQPYPFDVDTWNPSGESLVWVCVPTVGPKGAEFYFRWKHGKPLENDPTEVWTNYAAVFHFNGDKTDATGNGLNLTATSAKAATDAALGGCYGIDGSKTSCVSLDPPYGFLSNPANMTVSGWFKKTTSADVVARLMSGKGAAGDASFELIAYSDGNMWLRGSGNAKTVKTDGCVRTWLSNGFWSHLVGRYEGVKAKLYANGQGVVEGDVDAMASNKATVGVGNAGGGTGNNPFCGLVDEVRFYNGVASDAWIAAEYKTATLSSFATFGEGVPVKQARGLKILFY